MASARGGPNLTQSREGAKFFLKKLIRVIRISPVGCTLAPRGQREARFKKNSHYFQ